MSSKVTPPSVGARRLRTLAAGLLTGALMAACGGGQQVVEFVPQRVLALGDEASVIAPDGTKYSVNGFASGSTTVLDCAANPIWVQYVAAAFGLAFPECKGNVAAPASRILAAKGATSADVKTQIDGLLAGDSFRNTDLVTVLAGSNDILAQYALYDGTNEAALSTTLEAAGAALAAQVNRVALGGGRVLISLVPSLGLTPFAIAESADPAKGTGRAALLGRLTVAFNDGLRGNILNDGRKIGLLLTDELFTSMVRFPGSYSFVNVTLPACVGATGTAPVLTCTAATLRPADTTVTTAATALNYLWADNIQPAYGGHIRLGQLAESRARGNPF